VPLPSAKIKMANLFNVIFSELRLEWANESRHDRLRPNEPMRARVAPDTSEQQRQI